MTDGASVVRREDDQGVVVEVVVLRRNTHNRGPILGKKTKQTPEFYGEIRFIET